MKTSIPTSIFVSACLGMLLFGITMITLGAVTLDIQSKFSLDAVSSGTLFAILPFGILSGSLLFGPIADRFGYKIILVLASLVIILGLEGIAFTHSVLVLKISVFLFGLGGGAINGAANGVVSDISNDNRGANLSVLGVFFAIGALGMPFILGLLDDQTSYQTVLSFTGALVFLFTIIFTVVKFPKPKLVEGIPLKRIFQLFRDDLLLIIGLFLFCQSGFETILNNWTTTFLVNSKGISNSNALYALTVYVGAMAVMRLVLGSLLRKFSTKAMVLISIIFLLVGTLLLSVTTSYGFVLAGLILLGMGLAAGFPVMLGMVGTRYSDISGTAFSIVISIALIGSVLLNYGMGSLVEWSGISNLTLLSFILSIVMLVLILFIFNKIQIKTK
ncbi:MFS transporter [Flexithrix dorotheae]|uniref:MFS transporter n=1 Tax=Flexithrix dorotheae TaxID=70993 RepID=UPI000477DA8F|nr:MFS transporter [Flexithrix dorotheae]